MTLRRRLLILILLPLLTGLGVSLLSRWEARQAAGLLAQRLDADALVSATYDLVTLNHEYLSGTPGARVQRQLDLTLGRIGAIESRLAAQGRIAPKVRDQFAEDLTELRLITAQLADLAARPPSPGGAHGPAMERLHGELAIHTQRVMDQALRLSQSATRMALQRLERTSAQLRLQVIFTALAVAVFAGLLGWSLLRGIGVLRRGAEAIGAGDLDYRVDLKGGGELAQLGDAMNRMAARLQATLASRDELDAQMRKRQAMEEALRAGELRFRTLVDASAQIVWTTGPDGSVSEDSASWRAFTGQSLEQWLGFGWLDAIHPEDRPLIDRRWREVVANRARLMMEYRVRHVSGDWRWTRVSGAPLLAPDGTLTGWVGMNIDIQQERRALDELRTAHQALLVRERLSTIGTLAAGVAHEVNNPLMGIMNYVQYARARAADPAAVAVLDKAERDLGRIARIVAKMLDFSRPRAAVAAPVALADAVAQAQDLLGADLRRRGIDLVTAIPATLPPALADLGGIQQVLVNLFINARDALAETDEPRIEVTGTVVPTGVRLEVRDNGPGVAAALRGRIFDAFYTSKPPGQGTGLGLTVAAGVIQAMGGCLTCEPPADGERGARFRIELPPAV